MNCAIYGANLTGYYATKLCDFQNNEILFYIDKKPENKFEGITNNAIVYSNISEVPEEQIQKTDLIIVALGSKEIADQVKEELKKEMNCLVCSIHEEPYKEYLQLLLDRPKPVQYLEEVGYYKSLEMKESVDKNGMPIPWYSYALHAFIKDRVKSSFKVFEWGSGNSTLWWEKHVSKVTSIENNMSWYLDISSKVDKNKTKIIYKELEYGGDYCKSILLYNDIDIAIVDGRDRVNCAKLAMQSLNDTGIIIWDDTERPHYQNGIQYLIDHGFKMITFSSLKGIDSTPSHSSVFYRERNCLNI